MKLFVFLLLALATLIPTVTAGESQVLELQILILWRSSKGTQGMFLLLLLVFAISSFRI
jgi:hypothetical protein